jgi:hypothetical protein
VRARQQNALTKRQRAGERSALHPAGLALLCGAGCKAPACRIVMCSPPPARPCPGESLGCLLRLEDRVGFQADRGSGSRPA